jgi:hypothetical protein
VVNDALNMLDYIQTSTLVALLVFLIYLEKTMRTKIEDMPSPTGEIENKITGMTEVLDDIADLFNDALGAVANSPITQTASTPMESILSGLISSVMTPKSHGSTQEPQIGEIYQNDPPTLTQTENESN